MSNNGNKVEEVDFYPMWDYVLIDPIKPELKGNIALPEGSKGLDDLPKAVVVKAGPGTYRDSGRWVPNPLKVGDVIYHLAMMKPFIVKLSGHTYLCLAARDIVATAGRAADMQLPENHNAPAATEV